MAERKTSLDDVKTKKKSNIVIKVAMIGEPMIGKTSLMVKYVEGRFDEDYIQTLGVNFMEKKVSVKNSDITFSIWDLAGQKIYMDMLPLVCNDALCMLFMFDLSRTSTTLKAIREWYKKARQLNKKAIALLVGTKYDLFAELSLKDRKDIIKQARLYARAMKAPLVFCSASHAINIGAIFKIIFSKVFDVPNPVKPLLGDNEPIIEFYEPKADGAADGDQPQQQQQQPQQAQQQQGAAAKEGEVSAPHPAVADAPDEIPKQDE